MWVIAKLRGWAEAHSSRLHQEWYCCNVLLTRAAFQYLNKIDYCQTCFSSVCTSRIRHCLPAWFDDSTTNSACSLLFCTYNIFHFLCELLQSFAHVAKCFRKRFVGVSVQPAWTEDVSNASENVTTILVFGVAAAKAYNSSPSSTLS